MNDAEIFSLANWLTLKALTPYGVKRVANFHMTNVYGHTFVLDQQPPAEALQNLAQQLPLPKNESNLELVLMQIQQRFDMSSSGREATSEAEFAVELSIDDSYIQDKVFLLDGEYEGIFEEGYSTQLKTLKRLTPQVRIIQTSFHAVYFRSQEGLITKRQILDVVFAPFARDRECPTLLVDLDVPFKDIQEEIDRLMNSESNEFYDWFEQVYLDYALQTPIEEWRWTWLINHTHYGTRGAEKILSALSRALGFSLSATVATAHNYEASYPSPFSSRNIQFSELLSLISNKQMKTMLCLEEAEIKLLQQEILTSPHPPTSFFIEVLHPDAPGISLIRPALERSGASVFSDRASYLKMRRVRRDALLF